MKTKSSAKKRFKLTGTGLVMRKKAFKNHILTKKSKKRKRNLVKGGLVDKTQLHAIREMLCVQ